MNSSQLLNLIKQGETKTIEFKLWVKISYWKII